MANESERLNWRRSCGTNACVEVAATASVVYVRDSTDPGGPWLACDRPLWTTFLRDLKSGRYDPPVR